MTDQIYEENVSNYLNWLVVLYAKLGMPLYTWASDMSNPWPTSPDALGDPNQFARGFGARRAFVRLMEERIASHFESPVLVVIDPDDEIVRTGKAIDRRMWLNLADRSLAAAFVRSIG